MALSYTYRAVANGLRTEHPIPDLPFIDDFKLPLDDPLGIEAIGRKGGGKTWGREDPCDEGWVAFTTDPERLDLAWVVRWHPEHGRSVVVYRNIEAAAAHTAYSEEALLFRSGGYWWDGTTWYRPSQVFDMARGRYMNRPVPSALTVSAADLLDEAAHTDRGEVLLIGDLDPDKPYYTAAGRRWRDDLALWAQHHGTGRHLAACVVQLTAPELAADQLLQVSDLADAAGIAPSTLRAYLARGEGQVPCPQAQPGGRSMWSRPVAEDWAETRRRSDGVAETMADRDHGNLSIGVTELWHWFTTAFAQNLWDRAPFRKRFALRWRTQESVREVARDLAWTAAASLDHMIPMYDLAATVRLALMWEFADHQRRLGSEVVSYSITPPAARMLDWLIRHHPDAARVAIADLVGEAERGLEIPQDIVARSLQTALALDGKLGDGAYDEFMELALPPQS
ncbi:hypothetical protein [Catellatospora sp. NPDC049133]|uniref:hypothetical protein n=1 Tax=Catellatospora sp. NPDC049133 TaxID=3155499 RepID=UPI0033C434D5